MEGYCTMVLWYHGGGYYGAMVPWRRVLWCHGNMEGTRTMVLWYHGGGYYGATIGTMEGTWWYLMVWLSEAQQRPGGGKEGGRRGGGGLGDLHVADKAVGDFVWEGM